MVFRNSISDFNVCVQMTPFFQKQRRAEFKCIWWACSWISTESVSQYMWKIRRTRLFTRQIFAERLPGVTVILVLLDLAVKAVEMIPAKNLPSMQEGQVS